MRISHLFLGAMLLVSHTTILYSQDLSGKIRISVEAKASSFITGEMMYFDGEIENLTDAILTVNDPISDQSLRVSLLDASKKPVVKALQMNYAGNPLMLTLERRSKRYFLINLHWYGNGKTRTGVVTDFIPGAYTLSVELNGVASNALQFQVVDRSAEEMEVVNRMNQHVGIGTREREAQIVECKSLIRSISHSTYLPNMYCMLMHQLANTGRHDEVMAAAEEFLQKLPNHGAAEYAINHYQQSFFAAMGVSRSQAATDAELLRSEDQLKGLAGRYPQSKVISYAVDYYIKSYRYWRQSQKLGR